MVLDWGPGVKVLKPSEYGVWPLSIVPYASVGQGSKPSSDYSISSYSNCQQGRRLGPAPSNRRPQWVAFIDKSRTIGVESLPFFQSSSSLSLPLSQPSSYSSAIICKLLQSASRSSTVVIRRTRCSIERTCSATAVLVVKPA
jgi:hypothetical protein